MEFEKFDLPSISLSTALYSVAAFIVLFAAAFLMYPDAKYSSNIDVTADAENPEQVVEFDNRNVTLGFNESSGEEYLIVEDREEELDIEGRQNDIFAVDGKVYMFYFESGDGFISLLRIEQL